MACIHTSQIDLVMFAKFKKFCITERGNKININDVVSFEFLFRSTEDGLFSTNLLILKSKVIFQPEEY